MLPCRHFGSSCYSYKPLGGTLVAMGKTRTLPLSLAVVLNMLALSFCRIFLCPFVTTSGLFTGLLLCYPPGLCPISEDCSQIVTEKRKLNSCATARIKNTTTLSSAEKVILERIELPRVQSLTGPRSQNAQRMDKQVHPGMNSVHSALLQCDRVSAIEKGKASNLF